MNAIPVKIAKSKYSIIFFFFLFSLSLIVSSQTNAHQIQLSSSTLQVTPEKVDWIFHVHLNDFDLQFSQANESMIRNYVTQRLILQRGNSSCTNEFFKIEKEPSQELIIFQMSYHCPNISAPLQISYQLFFGDYTHRHLIKYTADGKTGSYLFSTEHTELTLELTSTVKKVFNFLKLGFEHILGGYDHLLFLLSVVWGIRKWKHLFTILTAFTVAHSLTLALSVLEIVHFPAQWVEVTIAASIVLVATREFFLFNQEHSIIKTGLIVFACGLVHGLGFSGILKEADLQKSEIWVPLLSFNLGVEGGQLLVVGTLFPLLKLLQRQKGKLFYGLQRGTIILIILIGFFWMVTRLK